MLLNTIVNIFRISCIMFFLLLLGLPCYLEARIYLYNLLMCDVWRLIRYNHQKKRISWSCHMLELHGCHKNITLSNSIINLLTMKINSIICQLFKHWYIRKINDLVVALLNYNIMHRTEKNIHNNITM